MIIDITVYPNLPKYRRSILLSGNAISPINDNTPNKTIRVDTTAKAFNFLRDNPKKMNTKPKTQPKQGYLWKGRGMASVLKVRGREKDFRRLIGCSSD